MNTETIYPEILSLAPDLNGETGAECEIILPDYCPNILRILQTSVIATQTCVTRSADRLTVEGNAEYQILYLPEDGSGIRSISQQAPFSCSLEIRGNDDGEYNTILRSRNCTARALNSRKIYVRNSIQVTVQISKEKPLPLPFSAEECETKPCRRKAAQLLCSAEKPLRISDEFEIDSGKTAASILQSNVTFRETEQRPLTDKLIVKADMIFDLLCATEDNILFTQRKTLPISQILDLPGIIPDGSYRTEFEIISLNMMPKEENEGVQLISYDAEINVCSRAYTEITAEWTEDAYSVKKNVECIRETVITERCFPVEESGGIREVVEIGTCTGLMWAGVKPELRSLFYRAETDRIVCEGTWECKILMTDPDGTPCSALREIPFTLELPANGCTCPSRNDTSFLLTDLSWTLTDASHLEIRGNYCWKGLIFGRETAEIVTGIKEISDRDRNRDTVTLYYAQKGDSAWKIAKEHACPYGELVRYNRLEEDCLAENQMLVIQNI